MDIRFRSLWLALLLPGLLQAAPDASRQAFRQALERVEHGGALSAGERHALRGHVLAGYLEYAQLQRRLGQAKPGEIEAFLRRHGALPIAATLRRQWLAELARRQDWTGFEQAWTEDTDPELRCHAASAALSLRPQEAAALDAAQALWLNGQSVPSACDRAFTRLAIAGRITPALRLQRIALAAEAGNTRLMRYLARGLAEPERKAVEAQAQFIDAPGAPVGRWAESAAGSRAIAIGLERLARAERDRSERLLEQILAATPLQPADQQRVRYALALWSAASYDPASVRRFAAVAEAHYDDRLREWRAREALARRDWPAAQAALQAMPSPQREEPRWRYLRARLDELAGRANEASAALAALARESHYHGFLAADRIDAGYAMCAQEPSQDRAQRRRVEQHAGLRRALELHALGRMRWALAEWDALSRELDADARRIAVDLAVDAGWTDRAVFALNAGDDLRYYRLRFPIAHKAHLTREAQRRGLDAAWVAALIRAESAWQPTVRSHADAYGLMQLLPSTGAELARRERIAWKGPSTLFEPRTNISLGTAYLADMLARKTRQPYLATAAYNAGPSPVARWLQQRPPQEADLWIETIPYKETRDYVVRVMAFSVIYDWRLGRDAYPLSQRLLGQPDPSVRRRSFSCPDSPSQLAARP